MKDNDTLLMPMKLQYFADPKDDPEPDDPEPDDSQAETHEDDPEPDDTATTETDDKNAKIIEKLQGRIGKEQGEKNQLAEQLKAAQDELEALKNGGKPKEKPKTEDQLEIESLKAQIARDKTTKQVVNVFHEGGVEVPDDIINLFVSDDADETIENSKKLLSFVTQVKQNTESSVRDEYRQGKLPSDTKHQNSNSNFGAEVAKSGTSRAPLQTRY